MTTPLAPLYHARPQPAETLHLDTPHPAHPPRRWPLFAALLTFATWGLFVPSWARLENPLSSGE